MATFDSRHSFRYPVLATFDEVDIKQRIVVLRRIEEDHTLVFYSDSRTEKIVHIEKNSMVSLCFFDPERKTQIQLNGKASVVSTIPLDLEDHQKSDYNSTLPPGSPIDKPSDRSCDDTVLHFTEISVKIETIDWLQLRKEGHQRAKYEFQKNGEWKSSYVIP